jgi:phosphoglycerol transferase MdoB-like AlkP superfamily enzyme
MRQLWLIFGWSYMRHLWLIFGWSALLIILLIPLSDSPRFVALVRLLVAISFIDFLLTAREILEEVDPDPKE